MSRTIIGKIQDIERRLEALETIALLDTPYDPSLYSRPAESLEAALQRIHASRHFQEPVLKPAPAND